MLRGTPNPLRGKDLLPTENENHECQAPSGRCFTGGEIWFLSFPAFFVVEVIQG